MKILTFLGTFKVLAVLFGILLLASCGFGQSRVVAALGATTEPLRAFVSVSANPLSGGSVSGGGVYQLRATVTVRATANAGYRFLNWTEDGTVVSTTSSYSFLALSDRALVANFILTYTIALSANPSSGGSVSGGGTFNSGAGVTVRAAANAGYAFVNWTEGANVVSTSAAYSFTATQNRTLVANFVIAYTITLSASPASGGSLTGAGVYASGATVTLRANPNAGYTFVNWTEGASVVSASAAYSFTATQNRNLVANFAIAYSITLAASPSSAGSVTGGGTYNSGAGVTVRAAANDGYGFVNWTEGSSVVSSSATYSFTATQNRTLVANFTVACTLALSASPASGGSVTGAGVYASGATATVHANANSGYGFLNWTEGSTVISTSASYSFTATRSRTLVANFTVVAPTAFTILVEAGSDGGGSVSGAGTYPSAALVTVVASASAGYKFVNWTEGSSVVSTSASYSFTAAQSRTLVAVFAPDQAGTTPTTTPPTTKPTTGAKFVVSDLTTSSIRVSPGESVTISATVENVGDQAGSYTAQLKVNNDVEATRFVDSLAAGSRDVVRFDFVKGEPANYRIQIGEEIASIVVSKDGVSNQINLTKVILVVAAIIVVVLVALLIRWATK